MVDRITLSVPDKGPDPAVVPDVEVTTKESNNAGEAITKVELSPDDMPKKEEPKGDLILGKFKTQEDLEKAYSELQTKLSQGKVGDETDPAQKTEKVEPAPATEKVDLQQFADEFIEKGKLADESYEKLEAAGHSREFVDSYIAGQQAVAERMVNDLSGSVGGDDALVAIMEWADEALPDAEKQAYNDTMNSGNVEQSKLALAGLKAKYVAENGQEPSRVVEAQVAATKTGAQAFGSHEQVRAAMADPRYSTDEAYRQEVYKRMAATNLADIK